MQHEQSAHEILEGLKNEINNMLIFFCQTDIKIYGHIQPGTVLAFDTQKVIFPEILKPLVKA